MVRELPLPRDRRLEHRRFRRFVREVHSWFEPARVFLLAFLAVDLLGTGLLMTPAATPDGEGLDFVPALFSATSALAVCGLGVISIGHDLTGFGQGVVLALIQIGGVGIMTMASLLGATVIHRFSVRMQLNVEAETHSQQGGDVRGIVGRIALAFVIFEGLTFILVTCRLWLGYDMSFGEAAYSGLFHAVSAFNNAGMSLYDDNFLRFSGDALILAPVAAAIVLGGIGFPVLLELRSRLHRPRTWNLHTKITVTTTVVLLIGGMVTVTALEWHNPNTLAPLHWSARLTDGFFHGVVPRSGGINVVKTGQMEDSTLLVTIMLMFVGGGSAGTSGGIKVTTLAVLIAVVVTEVRAHDKVHVFGRRLSPEVIRQSLSLVFLSSMLVTVTTLLLLATTDHPLLPVLFEVVSAFGVVGLSTGLTSVLPAWAQCLLIVLMVAGRIGPITFVTALVWRDRRRRYEFAEARPIIG